MAIALYVNLNKIALLRNSRPGKYPDPITHGAICLDVGAQGLTLHPRPDQLQVRWSDGASTAASEEHATAAGQSPGQGGVWHAGYVPPGEGHLPGRVLS